MDKMKNKKFDEIVIPENLSQSMREGIEEGEKIYMRNKRKRMIRRVLTAAAAFMICVGFFASQPALASRLPVIRNIFRLFQEDYSYQGDLDAVAVKLEEPEDTPEDMSVYTKTEDGVTVSISEAYCSVEAIYLSLMISSEEGFPDTMTDMEDKPLIHLEGTTEYSFCPNGSGPATGTLEGKFLDSHTYVGIYRIDILDIVGNDNTLREEYGKLDAFDMSFSIEQIVGDKAEPEKLDLQGKTEKELDAMTDEEWQAFMEEITPEDRYQYPNQYENWWYDGPFSFDFHIEADKESEQAVIVDETNDTGAGLYRVVKTKFEITVEEKCEEEQMQNSVFTVVLDGDGKPLPYGSSAYANTYAIYGRNVSKIYVYVCDYTEYMDDIKGYRNDADFKKILEEKALYAKEIVF